VRCRYQVSASNYQQMCLIGGQGLSQSAYFVWSTKGDNTVLKSGRHSKVSDMLLHVVRHLIDTTHNGSLRYRNGFGSNNTRSSIISLSVFAEVVLDFFDRTVGEENANISSKKLIENYFLKRKYLVKLGLTNFVLYHIHKHQHTFETCLRFSLYSSSTVVPNAFAITLFFPRKNLESLNSDLISFKKVFLILSTEKTHKKAYLSTHSLTYNENQLMIIIIFSVRYQKMYWPFLLPLQKVYPFLHGPFSRS
jgi:hypothetical protein